MGGGKGNGDRDIFGPAPYGLSVRHVVVLVQEVMRRRKLHCMMIGGMLIRIGGTNETNSFSGVILFGRNDC